LTTWYRIGLNQVHGIAHLKVGAVGPAPPTHVAGQADTEPLIALRGEGPGVVKGGAKAEVLHHQGRVAAVRGDGAGLPIQGINKGQSIPAILGLK
jgi:hypothetical protein